GRGARIGPAQGDRRRVGRGELGAAAVRRCDGRGGGVTGPLLGAIALPDGTLVRGRGRREPFPDGPLPEFGLYLGLPGRRVPWRPEWPADWIDWPDFRTPRDVDAAAAQVVEAYRRARAGGAG